MMTNDLAIRILSGDILGTTEQTHEAVAMAVKALSALPASPVREVVLCKDCKHHWTHKCMDSMPIEECDLGQTFYDAEVDYCSLAERRQDG